MSEKRDNQRRQSNARIRVAWMDQRGAYYQEKPSLVDYSDSGLCLMMNRRIEPLTVVGIKTIDHGHIASAVVRHVSQLGMQFRIGLEFPAEVTGLSAKF